MVQVVVDIVVDIVVHTVVDGDFLCAKEFVVQQRVMELCLVMEFMDLMYSNAWSRDLI